MSLVKIESTLFNWDTVYIEYICIVLCHNDQVAGSKYCTTWNQIFYWQGNHEQADKSMKKQINQYCNHANDEDSCLACYSVTACEAMVVKLWPLKGERMMYPSIWKISIPGNSCGIPSTRKVTNEEVYRMENTDCKLLKHMTVHKLCFFGHILRNSKDAVVGGSVTTEHVRAQESIAHQKYLG